MLRQCRQTAVALVKSRFEHNGRESDRGSLEGDGWRGWNRLDISSRHPNRSSPSRRLANLDIPRVEYLIYVDEGICCTGSSSLKRKISELHASSNG